MAKIHTHYDNLKVARGAPQEVIRAAYKALSQKYHPDKNQGDEKAARIMAIVNTAYNILSDPVRRKEHDEWIAAEEWEVEWLESSGEEGARPRGEGWEAPPSLARPRRSALRDPKWWFGIGLGAIAGAGAVLLLVQPPRLLPAALAFNRAAPAEATLSLPAPVSAPDPDPWTGAVGPKRPPAPGQGAGGDAAAGAGTPARLRQRPDDPGRAERRTLADRVQLYFRLPDGQPRQGNDGRGRQQRQSVSGVRQDPRPRPPLQRAPRLCAGECHLHHRCARGRQVRGALPERHQRRGACRLHPGCTHAFRRRWLLTPTVSCCFFPSARRF
ncbi:J domain-containing protein [Massilia sp. Dwa41.01b]|nr:J domain-containing protein [Massilia sp. Dwa41.01b]